MDRGGDGERNPDMGANEEDGVCSLSDGPLCGCYICELPIDGGPMMDEQMFWTGYIQWTEITTAGGQDRPLKLS